ncbi:hypothetical protein LSH36_57g06025 [Paralvinella palmiformis]|uniref:Myosin motor domain-containing protein n=1 Tax=Paralvinella palmiformis TaxID=53620 RepID=A0AAD9NDV6_9ANNE|nr:hypothetical protein LSH36_57g06025 [Paralvinella palmiformis]
MSTLECTVPHYVRCIKPNHQCIPGLFDQVYVLSQLEACGIIETVEISRQAYPARSVKYIPLILL